MNYRYKATVVTEPGNSYEGTGCTPSMAWDRMLESMRRAKWAWKDVTSFSVTRWSTESDLSSGGVTVVGFGDLIEDSHVLIGDNNRRRLVLVANIVARLSD